MSVVMLMRGCSGTDEYEAGKEKKSLYTLYKILDGIVCRSDVGCVVCYSVYTGEEGTNPSKLLHKRLQHLTLIIKTHTLSPRILNLYTTQRPS